MTIATWNGTVLAESEQTVLVEGNHYFPKESINSQYFKPSDHRTSCPWKGEAHYYDLHVKGETNPQAAWFYPQTKPKAEHIKDHVAFWRGVVVTD